MQLIKLYALLITSPMTVSTVIFDGINDPLYVLVNLSVFLTHLDAPPPSHYTLANANLRSRAVLPQGKTSEETDEA